MQRLPDSPRPVTARSTPWLLCALLWGGCSTVLGTDGTFVLAGASGGAGPEGGATGAGGNPGSGGAGGATAFGGSGGAQPDSGPGGRSGAAGDSGADPGAPIDSGSLCRAGQYAGVIDGTHVPGITFVGIPFRVKTGTLSFELRGSGDVLTIHGGSLRAELGELLGTEAGSLSSTSLTGTVDCSVSPAILTGELSATLVVATLLRGEVHGTWAGEMDTTGAFTGTWGEAETGQAPPASSCGSGRQPPTGTGCGTWDAR